MNILITGAGSTMGQSVMKALLQSKYADELRLFVTNSEPYGAGYFLSDKVEERILVPIARDPSYIETIKRICITRNISAVFSGTEHEILKLSKSSEDIYKETGAKVMLSRPEIVEMGTDKYKTFLYFKEHNLPFPKTELFRNYRKLVEDVGNFPIFIKPRIASASRNIYVIHSDEEMIEKQFDDGEQIIAQEYLGDGDEYTVGAFCDKSGNAVGVIPMRRQLQYGMSISGEIENNEIIISECKRIVETIRPDGVINIQLKLIGDKVIPFEINTRFSSTECVRAHYGFNAVEASLDHYIYDMPVRLQKWKTGMFMRYWEECYFDRSSLPTW